MKRPTSAPARPRRWGVAARCGAGGRTGRTEDPRPTWPAEAHGTERIRCGSAAAPELVRDDHGELARGWRRTLEQRDRAETHLADAILSGQNSESSPAHGLHCGAPLPEHRKPPTRGDTVHPAGSPRDLAVDPIDVLDERWRSRFMLNLDRVEQLGADLRRDGSRNRSIRDRHSENPHLAGQRPT